MSQFGRMPFRWPPAFRVLPMNLQNFIRLCIEYNDSGMREDNVSTLLQHPFLAAPLPATQSMDTFSFRNNEETSLHQSNRTSLKM